MEVETEMIYIAVVASKYSGNKQMRGNMKICDSFNLNFETLTQWSS